jgi:pilus assembly protein CpaB
LGVAVLIGLIAVYLANAYFSGIQQRQDDIVKQTRLTKIVVAVQAVDFAAPLTNTNVALVDWPSAHVPAGSFVSVDDATKNRVALQPIAAGEPIIAARVSGTVDRCDQQGLCRHGHFRRSIFGQLARVAG